MSDDTYETDDAEADSYEPGADEAGEPDGAEPDDTYADDAPGARAVLEHIVRSVVEVPEVARVEARADGAEIRLDVYVDPGDIGRVIGRRGRVAGAIRTVVRAAAVNDGRSVSVEFVEP